MRVIPVVLMLILTAIISACEEVTDLTDSETAQRDYINRLFCTTSNLFLYKSDSSPRDERLGKYYLVGYLGDPDESLDEHVSLASKGTGFEKDDVVQLVREGAYVHIEELFFYKKPLCCSYFIPVGEVQGVDEKRIDMSMLMTMHVPSKSPFSDYGIESSLKVDSMHLRPCG